MVNIIKNNSHLIFTLLIMGLLMLTISCKKNEVNSGGSGGGGVATGLPILTTTAVSNITEVSASSGGEIISEGDSGVTSRGVCWSMSQTPTISDNVSDDGSGEGSFTSAVTGLSANTTYYG